MALTVADVRREVETLAGRLMNLAGVYATADDGGNPYLDAAIRDSLQRMGYPLADPHGLAVVDADVAALDPRALRRLIEWAEMLALEQVDRDWWRVEQNRPPGLDYRVVNGATVDPLAGARSRLIARIAALREVVRTPYQSMNVPIAHSALAPTNPHAYPSPWWPGCEPLGWWPYC